MAEDDRINGFAWFLAGLGVGALVGLLYAPKSGSDTRDDLASNARQGKEYLRNRSKQVAEQVGTLVDRGKEQVSQNIDRGRARWEDFVERGKRLVGQQQSRVAAAVEAGRPAYEAGGSPASATGVTSSTTATGTETSPASESLVTNP
jgi:gas vesicle protein